MTRQSILGLRFFIIIFLFVGQYSMVQAQVADPRLEPNPQASYFAYNFDPSNWRSQLELAYWASDASDWEAAVDVLEPAIRELSSITVSMEQRQKGEAVLEFMHEEFLDSYVEKQSSLEILLLTGRYNCLSSAVLYTIFGTAIGLEVAGVNTLDHAFCSVRLGDEVIDVETTNPYGFDPGTKMEFQNAFGTTTGFSYVPPGNYRNRTAIDILRLFALLLQNRIADSESAGQYSDAVGPAVDRWALLSGGPGTEFEDLIIRILNYGTLLSQAGREEEALAWAGRGTAVYGSHPKLDDFVDGVANNLLLKLIRAGQLDEARFRFESLKPQLTAGAAVELDLMVSDSELVAALNAVKAGGEDSEFIAVLNSIKNRGVVDPARTREFEVNWQLYKIDLIGKSEGWAAAWHATEQAILNLGNESQLEKARRIYRSNHKAGLYNAAVDAYNNHRFDEAYTLVTNAMLEFPDESIFQRLLTETERAKSGN